ncbi:hypothetical protein ACIQVL_11565 [Streptomyces sp. NPDC090499]|uniref:hypothetical protein n=1 Tax=unclassified Streptomyces TaxID=2593676 RepID=UPI0038002589
MRLTLPMGLAAFMLAIASAFTPASAAANWHFFNAYSGQCLKVGTAGAPFLGSCSGTYLWHWGSDTNTWQGHSMRRLVNNSTGDCLTTEDVGTYNAVWTAPCGGGRSGQFWTADGDLIENQNWTYLYVSSGGVLESLDTNILIINDNVTWYDSTD